MNTRVRRWGMLGATVALAASMTLPLAGCSLPGIPGLSGATDAPTAVAADVKYSTADALADDFGKQFDDLLANPTSSQTREMAEFIMENLAPGAEDALMEEADLSSHDEAVDFMADQFGDISDELAELDEYKDIMEMKMELRPGDEVSESSIDSMNSDFEDEGIDTHISEAYYIEGSITCTLLDDVGDMEKGESISEDIPVDSIVLVKVDNGWYLWVE